MLRFRNNEKEFDRKRFKPKSTFNPKSKDADVEVYLSSLEEKLINIEIPQNKYNNQIFYGEEPKVCTLLLNPENT